MIRLILVLLIAILYLVIGCIPAFILWLIGKKNPDLTRTRKDKAPKIPGAQG